jgi:hypothetical protein
MTSPPAPYGWDPPLQTFHQRPPEVLHSQQRIELERTYFNDVTASLAVRLRLAPLLPGATGSTKILSRNPNRIVMTLALDYVQILWRTDLTPYQRFIHQFRIARTLIHETAHAMGFMYPKVNNRRWTGRSGEDFFENETFAEFGYSWENAMVGGQINSFPHLEGSKSVDICMVYWDKWPNVHFTRTHFSSLENEAKNHNRVKIVPYPILPKSAFIGQYFGIGLCNPSGLQASSGKSFGNLMLLAVEGWRSFQRRVWRV